MGKFNGLGTAVVVCVLFWTFVIVLLAHVWECRYE